MKIATKTMLLDEKDAPIKMGDEELTLGKLVSSYLLFNNSTDPLKAYLLGISFAKEEEVELDAKDIVFIRQILSAPEAKGTRFTFAPIALGQAIKILENK